MYLIVRKDTLKPVITTDRADLAATCLWGKDYRNYFLQIILEDESIRVYDLMKTIFPLDVRVLGEVLFHLKERLNLDLEKV